MNVLLVDNLVMPEDGSLAMLDVHPHLGLLALAAAIEPDGHRVRIYDPKRALQAGTLPYDEALYEHITNELLRSNPDVVGFTTLGCSFIVALNVAAMLKRRRPELPIVLGGPHATMLHREILEQFPQFDVVVRYEADETFPAVLANLERRRFEAIPGLSWRSGPLTDDLRYTEGKPKVRDLDSLPISSYEYYPVTELDLDLLRIEAGRGCPFMCTFCSTASFFQRSFRLKSANRLVKELDLLHERYGCSDFKLDHDMFTVNRKKVVEFCEAVRGRGYRWRASARIDRVDPELLGIMAAAGCVDLYFGIETGSARMQQICEKRLDVERVLPILEAARAAGIDTTASFICGYPEETAQDQAETLDLLGRCIGVSGLVQLHMLAPEPGTPMFDRLGAEIRYDGYGGRYNANVVCANDERLIREHPEIFQTYYYYPTEFDRGRHIFAVETVDLLRRAGPIVVPYMLRAFGGRLSSFVDALWAFGERRGETPRPSAQTLEAFFEERFGRTHHLTSLFRYALRANAVSAGDDDVACAPSFDARTPYRVARSVHVLRDLRDCAGALTRIRDDRARSTLIEDGEFGEPGVYLLRAAGSASACGPIDDGIDAILSLFERPRSCADAAAIIENATALPSFDASFFEELIENRILVASSAEP
ncbi:MAG TPA: radical SAM protein [Candidatus Elarobacter sp.]|nr:radical SAM protein [Candidatus Elarobacter sp.]